MGEMAPYNLILWSIVFWSGKYDVNPLLAYNICFLESTCNPHAVGDDGEAIGLWQWHEESFDHVVRKMVAAGEIEHPPDAGARKSIWTSTKVAMYAMGKLDLYDWWSTYEVAKRKLESGPTE